MASFPRLKTGVVAQHPCGRQIRYSTRVIRFLNGEEQRYRQQSSSRRQWLIRLDQLDEQELHTLNEFFLSTQGQAGSFEFTDPFDGSFHPNCSFDGAALETASFALHGGRTSFVITSNGD